MIDRPEPRYSSSAPRVGTRSIFGFSRGGFASNHFSDVLALSALAIIAVLLFRNTLDEGWTFVGDSDRLNTFMNVRLFETDWIRAIGRVPTWNDGLFTGQSMAGLHYMFPGAGFIAYLEALAPRPMLFRVMAYASVALLACSAWAAYLFIKDGCNDAIASFAGAAVYSLSVYSLHRLSQLDASFAVLIYLPLAMLLIKRAQRRNLVWTFSWLLMLNTICVGLFFLQEVAYAAILLSTYALHRSAKHRSLIPAASFGLAMAIAILIAAPRLLQVMEDFQQISRSLGFPGTSWGEVFRFFDEGIFGRYWGEPQRYGNSFGLSEGLQLIATSMGSFLAVWFAATRQQLAERLAALCLFAVLSLVLLPHLSPIYRYIGSYLPSLQIETVAVIVNAAFFAMVALLMRMRTVPPRPRNQSHVCPSGTRHGDSDFHIAVVATVLAIVLLRDAQFLLHYAFLKADFTHARFSLAALLPLSTIIASAVHELTRPLPPHKPARFALTLVGVIALGALVVFLIRGPLIEHWLSERAPLRLTPNFSAPVHEFVRTLLAGALLGIVLAVSVASQRRHLPGLHWFCGTFVAVLVAFESFAYSDFKFFGPNAQAPARPFQHGYMHVPPGVLNPPSAAAMTVLASRVQTEFYRSALIADPGSFSAYVPSHLSAFWKLRLVDGYGAGVPARLAGLPWPAETYAGRALSFRSEADLDWKLLALLNVKYAIVVDDALYYNLAERGRPEAGPADPTGVNVLTNPHPVMPRVFLARSAIPGKMPFTSPAPITLDLIERSYVEGLPSERNFHADGELSARFEGDRVLVQLSPAQAARLLVINELFHPRWHAYTEGQRLQVYPTNDVMRGVIVPPGVSTIELRFEPVIASGKGWLMVATGLGLALLLGSVMRRQQRAELT